MRDGGTIVIFYRLDNNSQYSIAIPPTRKAPSCSAQWHMGRQSRERQRGQSRLFSKFRGIIFHTPNACTLEAPLLISAVYSKALFLENTKTQNLGNNRDGPRSLNGDTSICLSKFISLFPPSVGGYFSIIHHSMRNRRISYKFCLAVARQTFRPPLAVLRGRKTSLRSSILHAGKTVCLLIPHHIKMTNRLFVIFLLWCGIGESNSCLNLGKVASYH